MKLHLPCQLYRAVLSVLALAAACAFPAHAALINNSSDLTSLSTTVFENQTASTGGGIYNSGSITLTDCTDSFLFSGNTARKTGTAAAGGAIYNVGQFTMAGGSARTASILFQNNKVEGGTGSGTCSGGAIYNSPRKAKGNALFSIGYFGSILFDGNTTSYYGGGAILNRVYNSSTPATVRLNNNTSVQFTSNEADTRGGAIDNGSGCTFEISSNEQVSFSDNKTYHSSGFGGAVYNDGQFTWDNNTTITFSGNICGDGDGGALCNSSNGTLSMTGNGSVQFLSNNAMDSSADGGAIHNRGTFALSATTGSIQFASNTATSCGGAIKNENTFSLTGNKGEILFKENKGTLESTLGGAIHTNSTFEITGNEDGISFEGNEAGRGGAIYNNGPLNINNNKNLGFSGNKALLSYPSYSTDTAYGGGAIYNMGGAISMARHKSVSFLGNTAAQGSGGAIVNADREAASITLSGNDSVEFRENSASKYGGAVYNKKGVITIADNGDVVFSGNYEKSSSGEYTLRSVYVEGGTLNLAAREGGSIEFQDTLYADKNSTLSFNAAYEGKAQTGDIIFTGQYAETTLNLLYGQEGRTASAEEVAASQTSTIKCNATLHNGQLIIKEGAVYAGKGLAVEGGSLLLQEGGMELTGTLDFAQGTSLSVSGANTAKASSLTFAAGSSFDVEVSRTHTGTAALTLEGKSKLNFDSNGWTLHLSSNGMGHGKYALLKVNGTVLQDGVAVTDGSWLDTVTVDKTGLGDIWAKHADVTWDAADATLYLTIDYALDWTNATQNGKWDTTEVNWADEGTSCTYLDGVLVVFGDEGAGEVTLSGHLAPGDVVVDNSEGHDYIWNPDTTAGGSLSGGMALEKSGSGKLTINTANDYTGGTTIKGGTLVAGTATALGSGKVTLSGGTLEIAAEGFSNTLSAEGESTLAVADGYKLTLTEALDNKGTLTLSGTLDASALESVAMDATRIDTEGKSGGNGFERSAGLSITLASGSTKDGGATILHGSDEYALQTDGTATLGCVVDYATYYLTDGAEAITSKIHGYHEEAANATVSMTGGALTVDDEVTVTATGGSVALKEKGKLSGSLSGATAVTVEGNATLGGSNSHTGGTTVNSGTLTLESGTAAGDGNIILTGGGLSLNNNRVGNNIIVRGEASLTDASGMAGNLTLAKDGLLRVESGSYTLGSGQSLAVEAGSKGYTGSLTLSGGQIVLAGNAPLAVTGATTFTTGKTTLIDLSQWEEGALVEGTTLATFNGSHTGYISTSLALEGYEGEGSLHFNRLTGTVTLLFHDPAANLSRNERNAYDALERIADKGDATGELGKVMDTVLSETEGETLAGMLDRVNGASLAAAMDSQIEGNLAHLRRLRQGIGSGDALLPQKGLGAYINAYNDDHTLSSDARGKGYRRTEWGAQLGVEKQAGKAATLGLALEYGRAKVEPSGDTRYHEDAERFDLYASIGFGKGWQSVTSVGAGFHRFDLRRRFLGGGTVRADGVDGTSFNLMEEINYTVRMDERHSLQPFLAMQMSVNHLDSFDETGAGNASLHGESRKAWATDITLGARYLYSFTAVSKAPAATLGIQAGVVASVGDTTDGLTLNFQGAPGETFDISSARRNRWGGHLGATLVLPVTADTAVYAAGGFILRGDSSEAEAQAGIRIQF